MQENYSNNEQSVFQLITSLCRDILIEDGILQTDAKEISKLRSKCFAILLRKTEIEVDWFRKAQNTKFDAIHELNSHLFATTLEAREYGEDATAYEEKLSKLVGDCESFMATDVGEQLLQLLLALETNSSRTQPKPLKIRPKALLVPGPFTLHANFAPNKYYPKYSTIRIKNAKPKFFQCPEQRPMNALKSFKQAHSGLQFKQNALNAPNERLMEAVGWHNQFESTNNDANKNDDCTFTGLTRRHLCKDVEWLRIDARYLNIDIKKAANFYALQMSVIKRKPFKAVGEDAALSNKEVSAVVGKDALVAANQSHKRILSYRWDQAGLKDGILASKPYISDCNFTFELQALVCQSKQQKFEAKILTRQQFIHDLKLLTVGLQSDTFKHNDLALFTMLSDITVPDILPATILHYVQEFINCGTCFKRLQIMIMKRDFQLMHEGFIFKALCEAIAEYLLTFRQFVFAFDNTESLIGLYVRMKRPMRLIHNLATSLAISPAVDANAKPPMGSQFLGYIYREIMRVTDNDFITLLMFLLKRCCHIYFKYLQLWMFHGILDDPSKELFIRYQDYYRRDTKHFYDKAYSVHKEAVPGFFQGYEDRILQCGKYTMLLKTYNPNHPIFDLEQPKISVRLSFNEIQSLEASCMKYAEKAFELCGKPVSVGSVFEAQAKRRHEFKMRVSKRSLENMERWENAQQLIVRAAAEEKHKRFEEMVTQMESARQQRLDKRRENVELELKCLREAEKMDGERLQRANINLRKRVEYYQELSDVLKADAEAEEALQRNKRRRSLTARSSSVDSSYEQTLSPGATTLDKTYRTTTTTRTSDEDDTTSVCTEIVSSNFELEFAKTAGELQELCNEKRNKEFINNNLGLLKKPTNQPSAPPIPLPKLPKPPTLLRVENIGAGGPLYRSISDVINSNLIDGQESSDTGISVEEKLNPLQLNRLKTLTGTIGLCFSMEHKLFDDISSTRDMLSVRFENDAITGQVSDQSSKRSKIANQTARTLNHEQLSRKGSHRKSLPDINLNTLSDAIVESELERNRRRMMQGPLPFSQCNDKPFRVHAETKNSATAKPLTDLEKNRRRVLNEEYFLRKDEEHRKSMPDFNYANLSEEQLTDRQRNRRRMMDNPHPFSEYQKTALSARPKLNLALDTERARNRRKVLESEYNIITGGDAISSTSLGTRELLTPMSTTSDPPLTENANSDNEQKSDIINGNLRLNISIASKATTNVDGRSIDDNLTLPLTAATTLPPSTPLAALTEEGRRARVSVGFDFTSSKKADHHHGNNLNLTNEFDELDAALIELPTATIGGDNWHTALIKNKFQGPTYSNVFRLNNLFKKADYSSSTSSPTPTPSSSAHEFHNFKIDSLHVITLTEFLQKSLIIPMSTHLELVNGEVMRVLLEDLQLIDHFRSLRHYFFMMDGEFGFIICDGIINRVENGADEPSKVLSYQMLNLILDSALSGSIQKDKNAENLSFIVSAAAVPAKFELTSPSVLNVLSLSYRVQWPLNLILNPETLEQYGNIFQHLLKVRRVSWLLERAFEQLRQAAKVHGKRLLCSPQYLRIQQIRHKFYHFVHALQNHITSKALQASWKLFKDALIHAKSLEDIYRMHTQYIKRIRFLCMLNRSSAEFNNTIENIFRISLKFFYNLKSHNFKVRAQTNEFMHPRFAKLIMLEEEFERQIKYTIYLGNKIVQRGYQAEIGEFITLININQYYTKATTTTTTKSTSLSATSIASKSSATKSKT